MTIDTNCTLAGLFGSSRITAVENNILDSLFAGQLKEQMAKAQSPVIGLEETQSDENTDAVAAIKEKGLVAYIMERHAKRIREEILESMGLTEQDLGKMSPDQRAAVEKRIAEETRKRMAAEALMQKGNEKSPDTQKLEDIMIGMGPVSLLKMKGIESTGLFAARQEAEER